MYVHLINLLLLLINLGVLLSKIFEKLIKIENDIDNLKKLETEIRRLGNAVAVLAQDKEYTEANNLIFNLIF